MRAQDRPGRRTGRGGIVATSLGLWLVACGSPPPGDPGPYRLHPSPGASTPEGSPLPKQPRPSPPAESAPPAPYPYPTPALPEAEPFEAVGMVLLRGEPASGITVSVVNNQTFRNVLVQTDEEGIYRAKGLTAGDYFVHYYNDRDNFKIGYWKTLVRPVTEAYGARFPAFELYLIGMQNQPGMGESVTLPARFDWEPYPLALRTRFRIHNRGGPSGKPYYVSNWLGPTVNGFTYDGGINQKGMGEGKLSPGRYLWGVYWDAGQAGEGGNLYQDFLVRERTELPAAPLSPPEEKPPADRPGELGGR
ncbi:hypothetical protein D3C87_843830 [compost metagenome]